MNDYKRITKGKEHAKTLLGYVTCGLAYAQSQPNRHGKCDLWK